MPWTGKLTAYISSKSDDFTVHKLLSRNSTPRPRTRLGIHDTFISFYGQYLTRCDTLVLTLGARAGVVNLPSIECGCCIGSSEPRCDESSLGSDAADSGKVRYGVKRMLRIRP